MTSSTITKPHLSKTGAEYLKSKLDEAARSLPGCFLVVVSAEKVLFNDCSGPFNVLNGAASTSVKEDTITWTSSASRLVIAVAYLQLVDRGVIALDTPLSQFSPELGAVSGQILKGFDEAGHPIFGPPKAAITLRHMLNGTSGFAPEFDDTVKRWKAFSEKGKGNINSCKVENLIYTPPSAQPGEQYAYGPSADWLSYIFPKVAGLDLESYLQAKVFRPLSISSATFFPYDSEMAERVMPLHWLKGTTADKNQYEEWTGQQAVHLLPKRRADIEYPTGGSGLYATASDYARLLQNILIGYQRYASSIAPPKDFSPILSLESYNRILSPDLAASQIGSLAAMMNGYFNLSSDEGDTLIGAEDVSVGLGDLPIYTGKERKGGWGRCSGSAGWGGAAGTDFYIDHATGIAVYFTTQLLPGSGPLVKNLKKSMEKAVYEALEMK